MNTFIKCTKCNYYHWSHEECAPIYLVYSEEYASNNPDEVHAH